MADYSQSFEKNIHPRLKKMQDTQRKAHKITKRRKLKGMPKSRSMRMQNDPHGEGYVSPKKIKKIAKTYT